MAVYDLARELPHKINSFHFKSLDTVKPKIFTWSMISKAMLFAFHNLLSASPLNCNTVLTGSTKHFPLTIYTVSKESKGTGIQISWASGFCWARIIFFNDWLTQGASFTTIVFDLIGRRISIPVIITFSKMLACSLHKLLLSTKAWIWFSIASKIRAHGRTLSWPQIPGFYSGQTSTVTQSERAMYTQLVGLFL